MNIRTVITFTLIALALPSYAEEPFDRLKSAFDRLPVVKAEYLETIKSNLARPKLEGGELVYGAEGSQTKIIATIGKGAAKVVYHFMDSSGKPLPPSESYWKDGKAWNVEDNGRSGLIGGSPRGFVNPLAIGYFVENTPVWVLAAKYKVKPRAEGFTFVDRTWILDAYLAKTSPARMIFQTSRTSNSVEGTRTEYTVENEVEHQGARFPKRLSIKIFKDNQVTHESIYDFVKFDKAADKDLTPMFAEKGLIRDEDTGIVYQVKNGQLVPDPVFSKNVAQNTTLRRIAFFSAFGILGAILTFLILRRRQSALAI